MNRNLLLLAALTYTSMSFAQETIPDSTTSNSLNEVIISANKA